MKSGHCICGACPACLGEPTKLSFWGARPVPVADQAEAWKAQGAAEERERIVKWLREESDACRRMGDDGLRSAGARTARAAWRAQGDSIAACSAAIERGDHIKQETKPNE